MKPIEEQPTLTAAAEAATPRKRRRRNERNAAAYDDDVCELLQAVDAWRRKSGRSFPAWSEVLQLLKTLGWQKVGKGEHAATVEPQAALPDPVEPLEE